MGNSSLTDRILEILPQVIKNYEEEISYIKENLEDEYVYYNLKDKNMNYGLCCYLLYYLLEKDPNRRDIGRSIMFLSYSTGIKFIGLNWWGPIPLDILPDDRQYEGKTTKELNEFYIECLQIRVDNMQKILKNKIS